MPVYTPGDARRLEVVEFDSRSGLNLALVGELIAEGDDLRHAAEMLDQADRIAEGLPADVVDRRKVVEKVRVRDVLQHRLAQVIENDLPFADAQRRHLLVVADDDDLLAEIERESAH
jgi:hypothetical protein